MQGRQSTKGKDKRKTADSDDDAPAAKKPKGGGGRGQGRKKDAPALGGAQTDLHGKRIVEKKQISLADMIGAQRFDFDCLRVVLVLKWYNIPLLILLGWLFDYLKSRIPVNVPHCHGGAGLK